MRAIQTFPVPSTKIDLAEFITYCDSNYRANNMKEPQIAGAWKAKREECINKANAFFYGDETLKRVILSVGGKVKDPTAKTSIFGKLFGK